MVLFVPLNWLIVGMENQIYLMSPYRQKQEGIEIFIRTILTFTAKGALFALSLVVVGTWGWIFQGNYGTLRYECVSRSSSNYLFKWTDHDDSHSGCIDNLDLDKKPGNVSIRWLMWPGNPFRKVEREPLLNHEVCFSTQNSINQILREIDRGRSIGIQIGRIQSAVHGHAS